MNQYGLGYLALVLLPLIIMFLMGLVEQVYLRKVKNTLAQDCYLKGIRPSICLRCGYNLSGVISSRCPECGQALAEYQAGIETGTDSEN